MTKKIADAEGAYSQELVHGIIESDGGCVVKEVDHNPNKKYITLARPSGYRTEKYIACIARGQLCLHPNWLIQSHEKGVLEPEALYALPRGLELSFEKPEPKWCPAFSWPSSASWSMSPDQGVFFSRAFSLSVCLPPKASFALELT